VVRDTGELALLYITTGDQYYDMLLLVLVFSNLQFQRGGDDDVAGLVANQALIQ
jgi:hypothetical protein